jgi:hypothetical protein
MVLNHDGDLLRKLATEPSQTREIAETVEMNDAVRALPDGLTSDRDGRIHRWTRALPPREARTATVDDEAAGDIIAFDGRLVVKPLNHGDPRFVRVLTTSRLEDPLGPTAKYPESVPELVRSPNVGPIGEVQQDEVHDPENLRRVVSRVGRRMVEGHLINTRIGLGPGPAIAPLRSASPDSRVSSFGPESGTGDRMIAGP